MNQEINGAIPSNNFSPLNIINVQQSMQFNYNNVLSSVQNYTQLNYMANIMTGIEAKWFRAVPDLSSADFIFKEYTLSNVDSTPMCIKVVVPNGAFPDSKYSYDLMGLEYDVPLEVQIDLRYWKENAGDFSMPQRGDIVYFPINNRLYEVNSSYEFRGFAEQVTAYKCALVKYQNKTSRKLDNELSDIIENLTVSEESLFSEVVKEDINNIVNKQELSPYINTERETFKETDINLKIQLEKIEINSVLVNESCYDLRTSNNTQAIKYKNKFSFNEDDNKSVSMWFSPIKYRYKNFDVLKIEKYNDKYLVKLDTYKDININSFISIFREGSISLIAKVINLSGGVYTCEVPKPIESYLYNIRPDWYNVKGLKCNINDPINILSSNMLNINIYNNKFIVSNFGKNECVSILPDYLKDKWYGICINISNESLKISHNLWEENELFNLDKNQDVISCVIGETFDIKKEIFEEDEIFIRKSYAKITNIRMYNDLLLNEKQQINDLSSSLSKDAGQSIILDNSSIYNKAAYINKPR